MRIRALEEASGVITWKQMPLDPAKDRDPRMKEADTTVLAQFSDPPESPVPYFVRYDGLWSNTGGYMPWVNDRGGPVSYGYFERDGAPSVNERIGPEYKVDNDGNYVVDLVIGDGETHYIAFDKRYPNSHFKLTNTNPSFNYVPAGTELRAKGVTMNPAVITHNGAEVAAIRISGGQDVIHYDRVMFDRELEVTLESDHVLTGTYSEVSEQSFDMNLYFDTRQVFLRTKEQVSTGTPLWDRTHGEDRDMVTWPSLINGTNGYLYVYSREQYNTSVSYSTVAPFSSNDFGNLSWYVPSSDIYNKFITFYLNIGGQPSISNYYFSREPYLGSDRGQISGRLIALPPYQNWYYLYTQEQADRIIAYGSAINLALETDYLRPISDMGDRIYEARRATQSVTSNINSYQTIDVHSYSHYSKVASFLRDMDNTEWGIPIVVPNSVVREQKLYLYKKSMVEDYWNQYFAWYENELETVPSTVPEINPNEYYGMRRALEATWDMEISKPIMVYIYSDDGLEGFVDIMKIQDPEFGDLNYFGNYAYIKEQIRDPLSYRSDAFYSLRELKTKVVVRPQQQGESGKSTWYVFDPSGPTFYGGNIKFDHSYGVKYDSDTQALYFKVTGLVGGNLGPDIHGGQLNIQRSNKIHFYGPNSGLDIGYTGNSLPGDKDVHLIKRPTPWTVNSTMREIQRNTNSECCIWENGFDAFRLEKNRGIHIGIFVCDEHRRDSRYDIGIFHKYNREFCCDGRNLDQDTTLYGNTCGNLNSTNIFASSERRRVGDVITQIYDGMELIRACENPTYSHISETHLDWPVKIFDPSFHAYWYYKFEKETTEVFRDKAEYRFTAKTFKDVSGGNKIPRWHASDVGVKFKKEWKNVINYLGVIVPISRMNRFPFRVQSPPNAAFTVPDNLQYAVDFRDPGDGVSSIPMPSISVTEHERVPNNSGSIPIEVEYELFNGERKKITFNVVYKSRISHRRYDGRAGEDSNAVNRNIGNEVQEITSWKDMIPVDGTIRNVWRVR